MLEPFRPCFTTPTFTTFVTLLAGMIVRPGQRTVCGMLAGAGLAGVWHHSRAHRFFAAARWRPDAVGLTVLRLIVGHLTPVGAPLLIAVDDTLFRRCGRKIFAAHWGYDGSLKVAKGNQKLSRGDTFVVAAVVVELPFLDRPVALPVLARLWRRGGPTKTMLARELIELIAAAAGRIVHVVGDGGYVCTELRHLPPNVTLIYDQRTRALLRQEPDIEIRKAVAADGTVTEYSRAQVVRNNFRKIAEGMPLTAREAELNRLGIPASQGGIWTARDPAQAGDEPGLHR
ncbi:transposase [Salinispora arenicola]|uniref:transposase n=1 Tax=Salinispora arenicola TaxID=168697 RepID=UPI0003AB3EAA|nr:transposase [Salinispora arenicola]